MKGELIFNASVFSVSLYLYYVTGTFKKFTQYAKSGPEFWPRIILVLMICLSGILLFKNIVSMIRAETNPKTGETPKGIAQEPYRFLLVVIASFAYAFGMGVIGFLLSTMTFQIIFLYLLRIRRFSSILFVSLLNTALLYILFIRVLNMLLPAGVGVFRTFSLMFY